MRGTLFLAIGLALTLPLTELMAETASDAPGAVLRGLDKQSGQTTDLTIRNGESATFGTLTVSVSTCRYPAGNAAADAYAHVTITDVTGVTLFSGWMIATSPALSAMDHPRYDVWVDRCIRTDG
jgi:hypothetical protein